KLDEGDQLIGVQVCSEDQDILLATAKGKCIRFPTTAVRVFAGRSSTGVRGIRLADGDNVISMSVLRHVEFSVEERDAYLRRRRAERLEENGVELEEAVDPEPDEAEPGGTIDYLSDERYAEMLALDQYVLTIATNGYGKRTSAYEYAVRNRGGQGIANIHLTEEAQTVVASFPVEQGDHLVLVTDTGQMIRTTVDDIR